MTVEELNIALILPYFLLGFIFWVFVYDKYFKKVRSSIQLLFTLCVIFIVIFELIIWNICFQDIYFLGISLQTETATTAGAPTTSKLTPFVAILSAITAIGGWIFTSRIQVINATKTHSMQVLMNSRTSTAYVSKVDAAMALRAKIKNENGWTEKDKIFISAERYLLFNEEERSAVHYMLNFLEFIAVGIRHNNLDEDLLKGSFRTILINNFLLFNPIIKHVRKTSPTNYTELEDLFERWNDGLCVKCEICGNWKKLAKSEKPQSNESMKSCSRCDNE